MTHQFTDQKEILERIGKAKQRLGKDLLLLAHFYQHDDIVKYADHVGDSLQLARTAAKDREAKYIVFCSVSFMAEMARLLCANHQEVFHPEPLARCPLADMAGAKEVEEAWGELQVLERQIVPVVYVNSNVDLKAFCGSHGGMVCTSANAKKIFEHILARDRSIFFFPDQNLGTNTARSLGIKDDEMFSWVPRQDLRGVSKDTFADVKVFLWKGFCYVHTVMGFTDIGEIRKRYKGIKVIVHPECTPELYAASDLAGSTSFIKNAIERSDPGSKWAVGTEWNFVNRIRMQNPDKLVLPLKDSHCRDMAEVTPLKLLSVLEGLVEGSFTGRVTLDAQVVDDARLALTRMLEVG